MIMELIDFIVDGIELDKEVELKISTKKNLKIHVYTEEPMYGKRYNYTLNPEYIARKYGNKNGCNINLQPLAEAKI